MNEMSLEIKLLKDTTMRGREMKKRDWWRKAGETERRGRREIARKGKV